MSTSIVEDIRGATEALVGQLHKSKDDDDVRNMLGVCEDGVLPLEQKMLAGTLGLLLELWPDRKTAKSVELSFGLRETLERLKGGESIFLTGDCPDGFQVEMKRLDKPRRTKDPFMCHWCCCRDGKLFCCLSYSRPLPDASPGT